MKRAHWLIAFLLILAMPSCYGGMQQNRVASYIAAGVEEEEIVICILNMIIEKEHHDSIIFDTNIAKPQISANNLYNRLQSEGVTSIDMATVQQFIKKNESYESWPKMKSLNKVLIQRAFDNPPIQGSIGESYVGRLIVQVSVPALSEDCKRALCYYEWSYYGISSGGVIITLKKNHKWALAEGYQVFSGG